MMKSKLRYYGNLLVVGLVAVFLDIYTDTYGALLAEDKTAETAVYVSQLAIAAFALFAMWANFNTMREKPTLASISLTLAALLVVVQYFFRYDTNLLWLLPMIAVVYIFRYDALTRN